MFQPLFLSVGLRYLRAKRRNGFISFISAASIIGIIIGVMALITTIAVMSGFQNTIRERLLAPVAHISITNAGAPLQAWSELVTIASEDNRVISAAPYVEREAMITGLRNRAALIRGVLPTAESKVSEITEKFLTGSIDDLQAGSYQIALGSELAMILGVGIGDKVTVYFAEFSASPMGAIPQLKRFTVSGIFLIGEQSADSGLALVHMADAQKILRMGDDVSGVRLKLDDLWQASVVAQDLANELPGLFYIRDWMRDNQNFFSALKLEKTVMFVLLSLVIMIAAFNLVSSMVMLVQDKQSDIAILRTLGLTPSQVMQIFMVQGSVIGVVGTIVGVLFGVLLSNNLSIVVSFIESITGSEIMPSDVYYITGVPTHLYVSDVVIVTVIALSMSFLATLYPAWRAARTDPAAALRYE